MQIGQAVGQPPERLRIFAGGRELVFDGALVRDCGLGSNHVMHAARSESLVSLCTHPPAELNHLWEGTPHAALASLVRWTSFSRLLQYFAPWFCLHEQVPHVVQIACHMYGRLI